MAIVPDPFFTGVTPACGGGLGTVAASGPCKGRYEWIVQARSDPSWEGLGAPSVARPIQMRLLQVRADDPIPGEEKCWNGTWIDFVRYGPTVTYAGDIIYLPKTPGVSWTVELRQAFFPGGPDQVLYSSTLSCTVNATARPTGSAQLDPIRFRPFSPDPAGFNG